MVLGARDGISAALCTFFFSTVSLSMIYQTRKPLILASNSPRRRDYLTELGIDFTTSGAQIDETPRKDEEPTAYVERMAREKAVPVAKGFTDSFILAADTAVCVGRDILGQPEDKREALEMLMLLSGRTHQVRSGICLCCGHEGVLEVASVVTDVTFVSFDETVAQNYIDQDESLDKAGGYGIQGKGAFLVQHIVGSYSNVVGLPLAEVVALLVRFGVISPPGQASCQ